MSFPRLLHFYNQLIYLRFRETVALTHNYFSAMKKMILTLALSAVMLSAGAQITERRMATLVETDGTQVFYGANAAKEAYDAAKEGATIILSEGKFDGIDMKEKAVKIYGTGMENDETGESLCTELSRITINSDKYYDDSGKEYWAYPKGIHIEGACVTWMSVNYTNEVPGLKLEDMTLTKCRFGSLNSGSSASCSFYASTKGVVFSQCAILGGGLTFNKVQNDVILRNCWLSSWSCQSNDLQSSVVIDHCILNSNSSNIAYYTNNIFLNGYIPADAEGYNNIMVNKNGIDGNATGSGNWCGIETKGIFAEEGEDGSYAPGKKFTLKYPKTYIGTDGTEVGINGGVTPWNPISSIPLIVSSKIDNRAAADGKINVSIKVEAQNRP